jgi:chromosome segregation ATPase
MRIDELEREIAALEIPSSEAEDLRVERARILAEKAAIAKKLAQSIWDHDRVIAMLRNTDDKIVGLNMQRNDLEEKSAKIIAARDSEEGQARRGDLGRALEARKMKQKQTASEIAAASERLEKTKGDVQELEEAIPRLRDALEVLDRQIAETEDAADVAVRTCQALGFQVSMVGGGVFLQRGVTRAA